MCLQESGSLCVCSVRCLWVCAKIKDVLSMCSECEPCVHCNNVSYRGVYVHTCTLRQHGYVCYKHRYTQQRNAFLGAPSFKFLLEKMERVQRSLTSASRT